MAFGPWEKTNEAPHTHTEILDSVFKCVFSLTVYPFFSNFSMSASVRCPSCEPSSGTNSNNKDFPEKGPEDLNKELEGDI